MGLWEQTDVCHRNVAIVKPYAGKIGTESHYSPHPTPTHPTHTYHTHTHRIKADHVRGGQCEETQHLHTFMSQTLHM